MCRFSSYRAVTREHASTGVCVADTHLMKTTKGV